MSRASRTYAKALFDIGTETGSIGRIHEDLHAVYDTLNAMDADLRNAGTIVSSMISLECRSVSVPSSP